MGVAVGVAVTVGVGVGVAVGVEVGAGVGVVVGVGIGVTVGVGVWVAVGVGLGVGVSVAVGVGDGSGVEVAVGVALGIAVAVGIGVAVGVGLSVGVGVAVGVSVAVGVGLGVGVSVAVGVGDGIGVEVAIGVALASGVGNGHVASALLQGVAVMITKPFPVLVADCRAGIAAALNTTRESPRRNEGMIPFTGRSFLFELSLLPGFLGERFVKFVLGGLKPDDNPSLQALSRNSNRQRDAVETLQSQIGRFKNILVAISAVWWLFLAIQKLPACAQKQRRYIVCKTSIRGGTGAKARMFIGTCGTAEAVPFLPACL